MSETNDKTCRDDLVELTFLESLNRRMPDDTEVCKALADLYTRVGRYEDGLALDTKLSRLCHDEPLVWYNLGCSYALLNRTDEALDALARAIRLGYRDWLWMAQDDDLRVLHKEERFAAIVRGMAGGSGA